MRVNVALVHMGTDNESVSVLGLLLFVKPGQYVVSVIKLKKTAME